MNVFEAVKQNVTTRQAAELYGIRVGRNGMAVCPFHNDKNPSMKLDRRFHCFGCQADGDAVDFVSRLFGLPSKEAAMKIADDFGISYDSRQKPSIRPKIREPTPEQKYQQEENHCYKVLSDYFHLLRKWEKQYAPQRTDEVWHPLFVEALEKKSYIEYLLDILLYDTPEEKKALVAEQRKEVINFSKSMRYNPMAYIHSEKDVLKLVTALMTNTKGEGQGGDPFWDKAERLLLVSLIAYLHYEAPVEEQNFATLLEMLNTI